MPLHCPNCGHKIPASLANAQDVVRSNRGSRGASSAGYKLKMALFVAALLLVIIALTEAGII